MASTAKFRDGLGWWRSDDFEVGVVGPDRLRFLNGMLTWDVNRMPEGGAAWAVKATNKGRIQGLLRVRVLGSEVSLDLPRACGEAVAGALVDHMVADDCELLDRTDERSRFVVVGREAEARLGQLGCVVPAEEMASAESNGVRIHRDHRWGVPGFEVAVEPGRAEALAAELGAELEMGSEAREVLRIEAGVPAMGPDLSEEVIALEAGLNFAIEPQKGCYIGQETIARAMNLGRVRYGLVGWRSERPLQLGEFQIDGKSGGEITSAAWSESLQVHVGLGYLRNEVEDAQLPEGLQATALPHVPTDLPTVFRPRTLR